MTLLSLRQTVHKEDDFEIWAECLYSEKEDAYKNLEVYGAIPSIGVKVQYFPKGKTFPDLYKAVQAIKWSEVAKSTKIQAKFDAAKKT